MKPKTIFLGIGLFLVVIFCAMMKGHYEEVAQAEHQKNIDSMNKVERFEATPSRYHASSS